MSTFFTNKAVINEASNPSTLVLEKYPLISFLNNRGTGSAAYTITNVATKYQAGSTLVDVIACTSIVVDASQRITVSISGGLPRVSPPPPPLCRIESPPSHAADTKLISPAQPQIYMPLSAVSSSLCPRIGRDCVARRAARPAAAAKPTPST